MAVCFEFGRNAYGNIIAYTSFNEADVFFTETRSATSDGNVKGTIRKYQ